MLSRWSSPAGQSTGGAEWRSCLPVAGGDAVVATLHQHAFNHGLHLFVRYPNVFIVGVPLGGVCKTQTNTTH